MMSKWTFWLENMLVQPYSPHAESARYPAAESARVRSGIYAGDRNHFERNASGRRKRHSQDQGCLHCAFPGDESHGISWSADWKKMPGISIIAFAITRVGSSSWRRSFDPCSKTIWFRRLWIKCLRSLLPLNMLVRKHVADFEEITDREARAFLQRDAFERVNALISRLRLNPEN